MEVQLSALKKDLEEPKEWPQEGDAYWYSDVVGAVCQGVWSNSPYFRAMDNFFRTEAEAQHHGDFLLVMAKLRRAAKGFKTTCGWGSWSLNFYDYTNDFSMIQVSTYMTMGEVRFKTEEDGLDFIESLNASERATLLKGWPT